MHLEKEGIHDISTKCSLHSFHCAWGLHLKRTNCPAHRDGKQSWFEERADPLRALLPSCPVTEPGSAEGDPSTLTHHFPLFMRAGVNSEVWGVTG